MKKLKLKKLCAFSLMELSVVIVIIGILFAGTVGGMKMISKSRLQSAQALTISSPVATTPGLLLWLETSMTDSFPDTQANDGIQLTTWNDRNPQVTTKYTATATASAGITYKNSSDIYSIPSVYFSGSSSAFFTLQNAAGNTAPIITPNNSFSFFVVAKLDEDANATKTIFSNGNAAGWGYGVAGSQNNRTRRLIFAGGINDDTAAASGTTNAEIISGTFNGSTAGAVKLFVNGSAQVLTSATATSLTPATALYIGNTSSGSPWSGYISEVIIFDRALNDFDRAQIEKYLGQKYGIKTDTSTLDCAIAVVGTTNTSIADGTTKSLSCGNTGYTGSTPSYSCTNRVLTPAVTATDCACDTNNGYGYVGGLCQISCSFSGTTGITNGTSVLSSTNSINCNAANFNTGGTVTYTCGGSGTPTVTNNGCTSNCSGNYTGASCSSCVAGYTLASGCTACDTAAGYIASGNTCVLGASCNPTTVTGVVSPTNVLSGSSGSLTCNGSHFSGLNSVTYNCLNGNLNASGTCACDTANGYSYNNGVCQLSCTFPNGTNGIANGTTVLAGTTSINCSAANFNPAATITYSCISAGAPTSVVNNCTANCTGHYTGASCSTCATGYTGAGCTSCDTGYTLVSGVCTRITCSVAAANGFAAKSGLDYATSATAISSPCQTGYTASTSPVPSYTCTAIGAATLTGSCVAPTCTITSVTGFNDKTGLAYATSATAITSPCQTGYTASTSPAPSYTCTTTGPATITGSCTANTCNVSAGTGYSAKSGLTGSGTFSCDAGYSGTLSYNCTTNGGTVTATGTCTQTTFVFVGGATTTNGSYTMPSGYTSVKVWVIGGGGGGSGGDALANLGASGGSGGVSYKTWTNITAGSQISYSIGARGNKTAGGNGGDGGTTTATLSGVTITATGGKGGKLSSNTASLSTSGGVGSGGDGSAPGGKGGYNNSADVGGAAIDMDALSNYPGPSSSISRMGQKSYYSNTSGLNNAVKDAGYPASSAFDSQGPNAPGGTSSSPNGGNATQFGSGGGGSYQGGAGGDGYCGGGGGVATAGYNKAGGYGGAGVVVIKLLP